MENRKENKKEYNLEEREVERSSENRIDCGMEDNIKYGAEGIKKDSIKRSRKADMVISSDNSMEPDVKNHTAHSKEYSIGESTEQYVANLDLLEKKEEFSRLLEEALFPLEISLTDKQMKQFYQFYLDLVEKNKVMNLTAITDMKGVVVKHFSDSLALIKAIPDLMEKEYRLIDIGTGAGFPGIPLAICCPQLHLTVMDSLNKRIRFIQEEIEKLELHNINAVHARAEELARDKMHREQYDVCVSRAVANLSTLAEYCLPFIHKEGRFIPYKSGQVDDERRQAERALQILGGREEGLIRFSLPDSEGERCLIIIRKVSSTAGKYPRRAGLPSREPLSGC